MEMVDYYELLGVPIAASRKEVKQAYYNLAKECHPDYLGEPGHNACILLNEAYEVLTDPEQRNWYDFRLDRAKQEMGDGYTGQPRSKWNGKGCAAEETRAVFVDECTCIGCKACVWAAPATFRMEPVHGRSYVFGQWLNPEDDLQCAIDSCPVDCIHWVERDELPVLEWVSANVSRVDVGIMNTSGGAQVVDPFEAAQWFKKKRAEKEERVRKSNASLRKMYSEAELEKRRSASAIVEAQKQRCAQEVRDAACRDWTVPLERALVPFVLERSAASQKQLDDLVDAIKAQQRRQEGAGATSCELKV